MKKALLLVDVQNDFSSTGALAVPEGEQVVDCINKCIPFFDIIIASQDWHPENHVSFAETHGKQHGEILSIDGGSQMMWPIHCVQDSSGADFIKGLDIQNIQKIIYKGTDPEIDSYSAFFDNARKRSTDLEQYLKLIEVDEVYVCGLATDYCVKFTALDAISLGFKTTIIKDACRAVNIQQNDGDMALAEMEEAGCRIITSDSITSA